MCVRQVVSLYFDFRRKSLRRYCRVEKMQLRMLKTRFHPRPLFWSVTPLKDATLSLCVFAQTRYVETVRHAAMPIKFFMTHFFR